MPPKPPLRPGSIVAAKWGNGFYYLAQTIAQRPGGFDVAFFDRDAGFIGSADIAPLPVNPQFAVEDHVLACWKQLRMFPGRVTAVGLTHCRVAWDDGDLSLDVPANQITYIEWADLYSTRPTPPPLPRKNDGWIDVTSQVLGPAPTAAPPPLPQTPGGRLPPAPPPLPPSVSAAGGIAMSIFLPGAIGPIERGERFVEPLEDALNAAGIGEVVGEGTFVSERGPYKMIDGADIQLTVTDVPQALSIIRSVLRRQAAPANTQITQHAPQRLVHTL